MAETLGAIYGIKRVGEDRAVYVGQTRRGTRKRWLEHLKGVTPISMAIQGSDDDSAWMLFVIERAPVRELNEREAFWIAQLNTLHPHGFNQTTGGSAPLVSQATRRRQSEGLKVAFAGVEFRQWRSGASKAVWSAHRQSLVTGINAAWARPERRDNHKASMKVAMADPDRRARISASMKLYRQRKREADHACQTSA